MPTCSGPGTSACGVGPSASSRRVVPRILDLVFRRAGASLDRIGRAAGDGRGQQFGEHRLGRPRLADQQQPAVARQPDDRPVRPARRRRRTCARSAGVLLPQIRTRTARGESFQPGGRGSLVGFRQRGQFLGVERLGRGPQDFVVRRHEDTTDGPLLRLAIVTIGRCQIRPLPNAEESIQQFEPLCRSDGSRASSGSRGPGPCRTSPLTAAV